MALFVLRDYHKEDDGGEYFSEMSIINECHLVSKVTQACEGLQDKGHLSQVLDLIAKSEYGVPVELWAGEHMEIMRIG